MPSFTLVNTDKFLTTPVYPIGNPPDCNYPDACITATLLGVPTPVSIIAPGGLPACVPFYWLLKSITYSFTGLIASPYVTASFSAAGTATATKAEGISPLGLICNQGGFELPKTLTFSGSVVFSNMSLCAKGEKIIVRIEPQIDISPENIGTTYQLFGIISNFSDNIIGSLAPFLAFYEVVERTYSLPFGIGSITFYFHLWSFEGVSAMSIDSFEITDFTFWNPIL